MCREFLTLCYAIIKVVFPFVLLRERQFYLLLLQLCHKASEVQLVELLQGSRWLQTLKVLCQATEETGALLVELLVKGEHGVS